MTEFYIKKVTEEPGDKEFLIVDEIKAEKLYDKSVRVKIINYETRKDDNMVKNFYQSTNVTLNAQEVQDFVKFLKAKVF